MVDASAKIPPGILTGNWKLLGNFDECVAVEDESIQFTGKYFFTKVGLRMGNSNSANNTEASDEVYQK